MGRELQKKKNKSSIAKVTRRKNTRIHKVNVLGNELIAKNWDKTQTLSQNYRRLGLVHRLNHPTGGTEKSLFGTKPVEPSSGPAKLAPGEARIERDEEGNIAKIVYGKTAEEALNSDTEESYVEAKTDVVRALEERAKCEVKTERTQSEREKEWIERLVGKYGHDFEKMVWDRKLNPYQQTVGDIRRRVMKWESKQKKAAL